MRVFLNSQGYSYDVHSLVKAFYPEEDVKIITDDSGYDNSALSVYVSSQDIKGDMVVSGFVRVTIPQGALAVTKEEAYENASRSEVKNVLKRTLYHALSDVTGRSLPWGTMTGIRPTKVPMKLILEGRTDEEIAEYLRSVYLCSAEKIALATSIAHTENKVISRLCDKGFSLYIGIPFCPTTCMYCSFTSYPITVWRDQTDKYLDALKRELDALSEKYKGRAADSIYIGGGTPTTLEADQLCDLMDHVAKRFDLSNLLEYTVEAGRPDSITIDKLNALKISGAGRISINPQTMNDKTLKIIGRQHTTDDVYKAFDIARSVGFKNINTDLILGLPGEDEADVANTFDKIKGLAPDSITVHSMAIKRAAAMHTFLINNSDIKSINTPKMMEEASRCADLLDMIPYYLYRQKNMAGNFENVGYAKKECLGIYNIAIMEEISDIAAAGAGTISKRVWDNGRIERCDNVKDVKLYIDRIDEMIEKKNKFYEGE